MYGGLHGGDPKWMVWNGKAYQHGWFKGTRILGICNVYVTGVEYGYCPLTHLILDGGFPNI